MSQISEITFLLHCSDFPGLNCGAYAPVYLGIQKGREIVEETPGNEIRKVFSIPVRVKADREGQPDFSGPFIHGKVKDRFIYLVWYIKDGEEKKMFRRAKVKLNHIDWKTISNTTSLQAQLKLKGPKGQPVCATLKGEYISWEK